MSKATKITLWVSTIIGIIAAVFFLIPLKGYKEWCSKQIGNIYYCDATKDSIKPSYITYVLEYWKTWWVENFSKENNLTYDGGVLPEIVVTPNGATVNNEEEA